MHFDLRGLDTDQVVEFIFAHPYEEDGWWWKAQFELDAETYASQLESIFRAPEGLLGRYSREQLDQGFWFLMSETEPGLPELLWNRGVAWTTRARLIHSTVDLYRKLVAIDPLDTGPHMFWDALAYGYSMSQRNPETNDEDRRVQHEMFIALREILTIDSLSCQLAALHGLGHLRHPQGEAAVTAYLAVHPDLSEENRQYALACAAGKIQ